MLTKYELISRKTEHCYHALKASLLKWKMGSDIEILTPLYSGDLNTDDLNAEKNIWIPNFLKFRL